MNDARLDRYSRSALAREIHHSAIGSLDAAILSDGLPPLLWKELLDVVDRDFSPVHFSRTSGSLWAERVRQRRRRRLVRRLADAGELADLLLEAGLSTAQIDEVLTALAQAPSISRDEAIAFSRRLDDILDELSAIRREVRVGEPLPLALTGKRRAVLVCAGLVLVASLAELGTDVDLRGVSAGLAVYPITRGLLDAE